MGEAIKTDMQLTHMPIVRVLQRSTKSKYQPPPSVPQTAKQFDVDSNKGDEGNFKLKKMSTLTVT